MITDYASLKAAIADELNRTDLESAIPNFVRLMESQTERQLRVREMVARANLLTSNPLDVPDDFLEARQLVLNSTPTSRLRFATIEDFVGSQSVNPAKGKPSMYTIIGDFFEFSPEPDTAYGLTLIYYQSIPKLSDAQTTNWLLAKHPDIYFYGSLLNSAPYLKEDARLAVWGQLYDSAIAALQVADDRAKTQSHGLTAIARAF